MRYDSFRLMIKNIPIITGAYLKMIGLDDQKFKNQLVRWQKRGKIIKLKRNVYILNENDRYMHPSRHFISYEMYKPSYVSLAYALSYYGIIPEKVADITCITTKKTAYFKNVYGTFVYQHIKENCYTGFIQQTDEAQLPFFMALPEKAVVDFVYLNLHRFTDDYERILRDSFRFQNIHLLKRNKIRFYSALFGNNKLSKILDGLKKL